MSSHYCTEYMEDKINDPHRHKPFSFIESSVKYRLPHGSVLDSALSGVSGMTELKLPHDNVTLELEHLNGKFIIFAMNTTENNIAYEVRAKYSDSNANRWQRFGVVGTIDKDLQIQIRPADGYSDCTEDDLLVCVGFGQIIIAFMAILERVDAIVVDDIASVSENESRAIEGKLPLFDYKDIALKVMS